jgi:hypothetical protein
VFVFDWDRSEMTGQSLVLLSLALHGVRGLEILELGGNSIADQDIGALVDILEGLTESLVSLNLPTASCV